MISQSYFPKQFPKIIAKSYSPKLHFRTKITPKNYSPFKIALQSYRAKQLLKFAPIPQNCFPILFHKIIPEFSKAIPKSCTPKLLKLSPRKWFPQIVSKPSPPKLPFFKIIICQYCCKAAELLPIIIPQNYDFINLLSKTAPQKYSAKLLPKAPPQNCDRKLLPKATILQNNYSAKLFQKAGCAPQNCSQKRFHEAASQSCTPKYLCKIVVPKL